MLLIHDVRPLPSAVVVPVCGYDFEGVLPTAYALAPLHAPPPPLHACGLRHRVLVPTRVGGSNRGGGWATTVALHGSH